MYCTVLTLCAIESIKNHKLTEEVSNYIIMDTIKDNSMTLQRWKCGNSTFIARPELGARLMSWHLKDSQGSERPIIYWPQTSGSDPFYKTRGGNPILFPFAGRSFYKGRRKCWRDSSGSVHPMEIHGFARSGVFNLTESSENGFTAELQSTEDDHLSYPYTYRFNVRYEFEERSLKVEMTLENLGQQPIPWSAGHHFYFTLPWKEGTSREDYHFKIPAEQCFSHSPDGSLASISPFKSEDSFGNRKNNDRIFTQLNGDCAHVGLKNSDETIQVRILQDTDTASPSNAFVIWSESENSPFYCVEPWMGPPNSAEHGKGLHTVYPGELSRFAVEVSV